ncbi:MAG: hypothetical protein Q8S84_07525 [bacterium]|nr:hypothetical protein [bacterium]
MIFVFSSLDFSSFIFIVSIEFQSFHVTSHISIIDKSNILKILS